MPPRWLWLLLLVAATSPSWAQDPGTLDPKPLPPLANPNDPKLPARELFGRKPDPVAMRTLVKPKAQSRTDFGLWTLDYLGWNCANCSLTKFRTVCLSLSETPAFARLTEKAVNQCSATGR